MAHHNGHSNSGLGRPMQAKTNSFVITRGPKSREPWYHYTGKHSSLLVLTMVALILRSR